MHQMGMRVGIPNAGQLNALETINIRGERSVTCKGAFDAHPSTGPLPPDAPPQCEAFRQQPDALERAAELDAKYGSKPDLAAMPMYCITASFKDPYDTKDMRTTSNNDVNFAMDVPPFDSTIVAQLRAKGAIIYAKSVAHEFNGGPGQSGRRREGDDAVRCSGGQQMNAWSGQPCNPYDTERVPRGTSNGSGVGVAANLVTVGICEQTAASCQGPASRNGITLMLTTKGLTPDSGGIGNQFFQDRAGIHARTLGDAAKVLDAVRDPKTGYFDPHDPFTAIPRALVPKQPYASFAVSDASLVKDAASRSKGMRIAILREHMVKRTANHVAISDQTDREFKAILRDKLGAELLETVTPDYPDDPDGAEPQVQLLGCALGDPAAHDARDLLAQERGRDAGVRGAWLRRDVVRLPAQVEPASGAADAGDQHHQLRDVRRDALLTRPRAATSGSTSIAISWSGATRGSRAGRPGWPTPSSTTSRRRRGPRTGRNLKGHAEEGKSDRLARSHIARMALLKVMYENDIDVFVHAENTVPTPKLLGPNVGTASLDGITPFFQIPKIVVPAGFTDVEVAAGLRAERGRNELHVGPAARARSRRRWNTRCRLPSRSSPGRVRSRR